MSVFVDTSAFLAVLNADDVFFALADNVWQRLCAEKVLLRTSNYVVLEATAVIQRRLGMDALRAFCSDMLPVFQVEWVTPQIHSASVKALLAANRHHLSLVDCASFEIMRALDIQEVFTFDSHFSEQGFSCRPEL